MPVEEVLVCVSSTKVALFAAIVLSPLCSRPVSSPACERRIRRRAAGRLVEAASPALIEKVRSAVTDGTGLYRLEDLPAGRYSVTFTLPGFATSGARRPVTTGVTVTLNAD